MKQNKAHPALAVLFLLYLAALLRLTVLRDGCFSHGLMRGKLCLMPAVNFIQLWRWRSYPTFFYLLLGNIAWFMPLGAYARYRGARFSSAVLYGAALSLLIEVAQFALGSGISETDDLALNALGAAAGYGAAAALGALGGRIAAGRERRTHAARK